MPKEVVPPQDLTDETIRDWKSRASKDELNIFNDRNTMIVLLCREVEKARTKLEEMEELKSKG